MEVIAATFWRTSESRQVHSLYRGPVIRPGPLSCSPVGAARAALRPHARSRPTENEASAREAGKWAVAPPLPVPRTTSSTDALNVLLAESTSRSVDPILSQQCRGHAGQHDPRHPAGSFPGASATGAPVAVKSRSAWMGGGETKLGRRGPATSGGRPTTGWPGSTPTRQRRPADLLGQARARQRPEQTHSAAVVLS